MTDVSFEEEALTPTYARPVSTQKAGLTQLLTKWGIAKDARSANIILIGIALSGIVLTFFLLRATFVPASNLTPEQQRQIEWMKQGNIGPAPASFMPAQR